MRRGLFSGVVCKLRPVVHLSPVVLLLLNDACVAHGLISGVSAGVVSLIKCWTRTAPSSCQHRSNENGTIVIVSADSHKHHLVGNFASG